MFEGRRQRFPLGQVVVTTNALFQLDAESIETSLRRHASGDWGDLDSHNGPDEASLRRGGRLLSVFQDQSGTRFYVITESDRSVTTVLLPEDY